MKVAPNAQSDFHALPLSSLATHHPPVAAFLIANPRVKFRLNNTRQSRLRISNRERIAILTIRPGLSSRATSGSRGISLTKNTQGPSPATAFLIGTLPISKIESTRRKHATKGISNRYKNGISANSQARSIASVSPAASYPFAQFPNHLLRQTAQMLPLEIAPGGLGDRIRSIQRSRHAKAPQYAHRAGRASHGHGR